MLERFAKEDLGEVVGRNGANSTAKGPDADGDRDRDDVGVPMQRQPPADLEADQRKRKKAVEKPPTKKLRVIRKKEDSSIDDLFAGL